MVHHSHRISCSLQPIWGGLLKSVQRRMTKRVQGMRDIPYEVRLKLLNLYSSERPDRFLYFLVFVWFVYFFLKETYWYQLHMSSTSVCSCRIHTTTLFALLWRVSLQCLVAHSHSTQIPLMKHLGCPLSSPLALPATLRSFCRKKLAYRR